jgi:hypothetical protein
MPAGNYYVHNVSCPGAATIICTSGPVTIYVTGTFNVGGKIYTYNNLPGNLTIVMCSANSFTLSSNAAVYASIYAPQSSVTLSGNGDIYGSVLGLSVSMTGTSAIHYDLSLSAGGSVSSVQ